MKNVNIIYWSGTGNTEKMANLIEDTIKATDNNVKLINVSDATQDDVTSCDILFLGSPASGDETIEENEMQPFVDSIESIISGKTISLFGSYGWGGGAYMETWVDTMKSNGANVIGNGIVVEGEPTDDTENEIKDLVKEILAL